MTDTERARYEDAKRTHAELMKVYPFTLDNLDGEIWSDIVGYEGHYQISTFGRVKSLKKGREKILMPFIDKDGYFSIALSKESTVRKFKIHRLVAQAFIPNLDDKPHINHIDGNKMNNHVSNLEWCTNRENNYHAIKMGLRRYQRNSHRALTDEQAAWCRKVHIPFDSELGSTALANIFGITQPCMNAILHGKTYKDVVGVDVEQTVYYRADCRHSFR